MCSMHGKNDNDAEWREENINDIYIYPRNIIEKNVQMSFVNILNVLRSRCFVELSL